MSNIALRCHRHRVILSNKERLKQPNGAQDCVNTAGGELRERTLITCSISSIYRVSEDA